MATPATGGAFPAQREIMELEDLWEVGVVCHEVRPVSPRTACLAVSIKAEPKSEAEEEDCPVPFTFPRIKDEPESDLDEHRTLRDDGRPLLCDVCNKSFSEQLVLMRHQLTHNGERPYVCEVCNKSFSKKYSLKIHLRIHSGERPCVCDVCNKSFRYQLALKRHQLTHSGEPPYVCDVCNKSFS
jgi:uncharacterized Zn-finger protein